MRVRSGSLVVAGLIASACAVHINEGAPPPAPAAAPAPAPAPAPPPAPAPVAASPAPASPAPLVRGIPLARSVVGQPAPAPAAPNVTTPPQSRTIAHVSPALLARMDPVNVHFLQLAHARQPKACGPQEVAPGVWVRIDCHAYQPVSLARAHWSARKVKVVGAIHAKYTLPRHNLFGRGGGGGGEKASGPGAGGGGVAAGAGDFPEIVDHRTTGGEGPIKNQGYVGSCTAFSLSSAMDNALRRAGRSEVISPTHIWSHYGSPHMSLAGDANLNKPLTSFDVWPYSGIEACKLSTDPSDDCGDAYGVTPNTAKSDRGIQAELAKADQNTVQKIVAIERLQVSPPDINEIKTVLAGGSDLWIAMRIGPTWMSARTMPGGVINDWNAFEGGHAIVMSGYRKLADGTHQFLIHNSWGESWGDHGYAWVSEAMITKWLSYAYKIKIDAGAQPVAQITDDDCADDELVDSVTGQCAKMCSDESRPANGQCGAAGDSTGSGLKKH